MLIFHIVEPIFNCQVTVKEAAEVTSMLLFPPAVQRVVVMSM